MRRAVADLMGLWGDLHEVEARHALDVTRRPDPGLVEATFRWASGTNLLKVLSIADIGAGDLVRWMRQVIDLLGQIAQAVPADDPLRERARIAADLVNRGVVAF